MKRTTKRMEEVNVKWDMPRYRWHGVVHAVLPAQREGGGLVAEQADGEAVERLADRQLR